MTISTKIRNLALPLFATAIFASGAHANTLPKVAINGVVNGAISISGPFQISGYAGDTDGINEIYGTIQNPANKLFYSPDGKFVEEPTRLGFRFNKNKQETNWVSNSYNIPPGRYLYRMRVEDGQKGRTEIIQVPVMIRAAAQRATAAAQPTQPAQPAAQPAAKIVTPAATVAAGAKAANGMNYCSNGGTDADNDGYGWENNSSCIVAGSKADKHPNCATAGSDPDGDGWGWENERSCVVVVRCATGNSDADGDGWGWENGKSCKVVKTTGKYPPCANPASDPDGDGYGWENNKSCLVAR